MIQPVKEIKKCYFYIEEIDGVEYMCSKCEECFKKDGIGFLWLSGFGNTKNKIVCKCGAILNECNNKDS